MAARAPAIGVLLVTLVALLVLGRGVAWAAAPVFWGSPEEYADVYQGRTVMLIATAVLLIAGGVFAWQGRWPSAVLVASPGVLCTLIVLVSSPGSNAYALVLYLPLAPIAAAAALVATIRRPASG